ncbi:prolipoprotein diacylglyceryl transferase [Patescibacteria group bacterium]|nr:prolipoprotein diacylglyceryl transferase [Patescibacteria group bacterium]
MIPFFQLTQIPIGPLNIQAWGTLVALGLLLGTWVSAKRAKTQGFEPKLIWDFAFWTFLAAFLGARIFHVLFYDFGHYLANPLDAINPALPGFSVIGGFIGASITVIYLIRKHKLPFYKFADAAIFGLPFGLMIGRLGCFVIHDHPGIPCLSNPLCVLYPDGIARHDHGLYLAMLGAITAVIFYIFGRKQRPDGFFLSLYLIIYSFSRFFLDFYRAIDARYLYLTPTQWLLLPAFFLGVYIFYNTIKLSTKK